LHFKATTDVIALSQHDSSRIILPKTITHFIVIQVGNRNVTLDFYIMICFTRGLFELHVNTAEMKNKTDTREERKALLMRV